MKRAVSLFCVLCLLCTTVPAYAASDVEPELPRIMEPIISTPGVNYVPSANVSDYYICGEMGGTYIVACGDEVVGYLHTTSYGYLYDSVDKESPVAHAVNYGGKTLNIQPIKQTGSNDCWAACCAMVINYYEKAVVTMTPQMILQYAGKTNSDTANWSIMYGVYAHWGLYPTEVGVNATLLQVSSWIDNNCPLHIGCQQADDNWTGIGVYHSVLVTGYGTGAYYDSIVIIDPWTGKTYSSVYSNITDKLEYNGYKLLWEKTRYGF